MEQQNKEPLYIKAKLYLLDRIRKMAAGANKIEPENTLAEKLGMSRETVRKAMTVLIQEGVITRWHGKGNYGHPDVSNLNMRIDLNSDFRHLLTDSGYDVRTFRAQVETREASAAMVRRMPAADGARVVASRQDYYANDVLAVVCYVELLEDIVDVIPEEGEYTESMKEFICAHCTTKSNHTTAWLLAEHNPEVAERFSLIPGAPLFCWEEIYYNLLDEKMGYVKIYFNQNVMDLSLMLKF